MLSCPIRQDWSEDRNALAQVKLFVDLWRIDPFFHAQVKSNPVAATKSLGMDIDPEHLRPIWARGEDLQHSPLLRAFVEHQQQRAQYRHDMRHLGEPTDPNMAAWRRRQIARCVSELGQKREAELVHAPVVFELSEGCSVGCWFCGLGAHRPVQHASYAQTKELWRNILCAVRSVLGEGVRWGFCYWATDPLDNPDYLEFAEDFNLCLGRFPQTTTAIPLRNPIQTRRLLQRSIGGRSYVRFSIRSRIELRRVIAEFSPEELLDVDLLPLNRESGFLKVFAGNARAATGPRTSEVLSPEKASTIACVSGFLINLVTRRIRLITPCNANEFWPLGYWIAAETMFSDADELEAILRRTIRECMPIDLGLDRPVRFRRDLKLVDSQPVLRSHWMEHHCTALAAMPNLGKLIYDGNLTAAEIALALEGQSVPLANTLYAIQELFKAGLLYEEPDPSRPSTVSENGNA